MTEQQLMALSQQLGTTLLQQRRMLTTAESCTGGWVAQVITAIAGSSQWFERGFVTYTNDAKREMLGVSNETLQTYGAVSEATVIEMARGALQHSHASVSLAVSGIAGPTGGTAEKPVGMVWFAWVKTDLVGAGDVKIVTRSDVYTGDRHQIRRQAVIEAIQGALTLLQGA